MCYVFTFGSQIYYGFLFFVIFWNLKFVTWTIIFLVRIIYIFFYTYLHRFVFDKIIKFLHKYTFKMCKRMVSHVKLYLSGSKIIYIYIYMCICHLCKCVIVYKYIWAVNIYVYAVIVKKLNNKSFFIKIWSI